jgi:hypothetical protein
MVLLSFAHFVVVYDVTVVFLLNLLLFETTLTTPEDAFSSCLFQDSFQNKKVENYSKSPFSC